VFILMGYWWAIQENLKGAKFRTYLKSFFNQFWCDFCWMFFEIKSIKRGWKWKFFWKFVFGFKVNIYLQNMSLNVYFRCFLCAYCLPVSLIMHVPISTLHAQWHWCLHFSMSLNSRRFLQFHPTTMLISVLC
jgi:hypothetical protein